MVLDVFWRQLCVKYTLRKGDIFFERGRFIEINKTLYRIV